MRATRSCLLCPHTYTHKNTHTHTHTKTRALCSVKTARGAQDPHLQPLVPGPHQLQPPSAWLSTKNLWLQVACAPSPVPTWPQHAAKHAVREQRGSTKAGQTTCRHTCTHTHTQTDTDTHRQRSNHGFSPGRSELCESDTL